MIVENAFSLLIRQMLFQAPMLLVYMAALVLALVYMRRAPMPALLTLVAAVILLAASITVPLVQSVLFSNRSSVHPAAGELIVMAGSVVRAVGTMLLVVAVFLGRGKKNAPERVNPSAS